MSLPLDQMIQPDKAYHYWENVHPIWFYDAEKDPIEKMRKPGTSLFMNSRPIFFLGVFKPEFEVTNGSFVGLSNKVCENFKSKYLQILF